MSLPEESFGNYNYSGQVHAFSLTAPKDGTVRFVAIFHNEPVNAENTPERKTQTY